MIMVVVAIETRPRLPETVSIALEVQRWWRRLAL